MAIAQEQARPQQQIVQNQDGDDQASKQAVIVLPSDLLPIVNPGELRFADIDWNGPAPVPIEGDAFAAPVDNQRAVSQDKPKKLLKEEEFPPSRITAQCDLPNILPSPLKYDAWKRYLVNHPSEEEVKFVLDTIKFGAKIECKPDDHPPPPVPENLSSTFQPPNAVESLLQDEIVAGRLAGPFDKPPIEDMWFSPLGLVPKEDKFRLITHLSYPRGDSVNDFIKDKLPCPMTTFDLAAQLVVENGSNCLMSKIDVKGAFRLIPVRPSDRKYLGYKWRGKYYVDLCLPFGMKSSPSIWCRMSQAILWIIQNHLKISSSVCYVDDFLVVSNQSEDQANADIDTIIQLCEDLGVPLALKKLIRPTTKLTYLGIGIDSTSLMTFVTPERKQVALEVIKSVASRRSCSKKELQSLLGQLYFLTRSVPYGRAFLARGVELLRSFKTKRLWTRLNVSFHKDLHWWLEFLPRWHGQSLIPPRDWPPERKKRVYTNASELGDGAFFQGKWISMTFSRDQLKLAMRDKRLSMPYLELLSIAIAVETWAEDLKECCVELVTDSESCIPVLEKMSSRHPAMSDLVRSIAMLQCVFGFRLLPIHIRSEDNVYADLLSRDSIQEFINIAPPNSDQLGTVPRMPSFKEW